MKRLVILFAAVLALAACGPAALAATGHSHGLKQVRDPRHVTGTIRGHCAYRDKGNLPDPRCTPGSIDPVVTQGNIRSTICKGGWTDPHLRPPEPQTEAFKKYVAFPAYRLTWYRESELDHLVPLELGGSNDATNLWPELGLPSGNPKDKVEDALNHAVCDGRVSLVAAQDAIAADWLTAEHKLGIGPVINPGSGPPKPWCTASASWNASYGDYDVYVHSNQPRDTKATATASNRASDYWWTDASGYTVIYLHGAGNGETVKVSVGGASCSTVT